MNSPNTAPFDSEAGFRQAIDTVIAAAADEIRIFDRDLSRVAIDRKNVAEALERFLAAERDRRLRIVVHDPEYCERSLPRVLALIKRFGQALEVRQTPEELRHLQESYLLADATQGAIRFHTDHARGKIVLDAAEDIRPWWDRFDDLWLLSTPCLSPTRLGL